MNQKYIATIFIFLSIIAFGNAQLHQSTPHKQPFFHKDTSIHSIKDFFKKSHLHGHIRNSFMMTTNEGTLKDYWTNATGGAIGMETAELHGFQLGVKGIFTYQTISADLNEIDPISGRGAKWETELYDINRPMATHDFDRLEELYIKYNYGKSFITYGKIDINRGPLFLRRDGRMKPFVYKGFWSEINEFKDQKITLGWIYGVSPRAMTEWYGINEAIGMLNNGYHTTGEKAHYHETTDTKGIGIVGYQHEILKGLTIQYWNFLFHRLFDMHWLQLDYKQGDFFVGIQYVHQNPDKYQVTLDYNQRYMQPHERGNVVNIQGGYQHNGFSVSAIYLHSFETGRFLFPRELGRENFYASQPRSWIDGFGDAKVWMLRFKYRPTLPKWKNLSLDMRFSETIVADRTDPIFNKYKLPTFYQLTFLGKYKFDKVFDGLELGLLYITKYSPAKERLTGAEKFYLSGFHHLNLVANIDF